MRVFLAITLMLFFYGNVCAEKIYKSVDEQGNVTYSSQPPADAVKSKQMAVEPGPTSEEISESKERTQEMKEAGESLSETPAQPKTSIKSEETQVNEEQPTGVSSNNNPRGPRDPRGPKDPRGPLDPRSPSKVTPVKGIH